MKKSMVSNEKIYQVEQAEKFSTVVCPTCQTSLKIKKQDALYVCPTCQKQFVTQIQERWARGSGKEAEKGSRRSISTKVILGVVFVIFVIYAITLLFPLLWCVYNSFKLRQEFLDSVWALPKYWYIENWYKCFQMEYNGVNLLGMFGNTIIFTVGCTVAGTFFSMATAYVLTKYPFPGSSLFYSMAFVLMMIPMVGNTAAVYKLYHNLKMYDTYWGPIISSCGGFGMGFVLLYGFFKNISWTYAEAAFLDGAGHFTVFLKIMMPMAMPAITAIAIQGAIGIWNEYYTFYMYAPNKVTVALGLYGLQMQNQYGKISYPQLFAAMTISTLPVIIIYAFAQKFIIKNTTLGGIKG